MNLRDRLQRGLDWAKENDVKVVTEDFGSRSGGCGCLLSCAAWAEGSEVDGHSGTTVAQALGLTRSVVEDIIDGFDEARLPCEEDEYYVIGEEFRKQVFG